MAPRSHSSNRPVTLKDVACAAKVSYQTVSRAVNGYSDISAETSERVLAVARKLGYRPNRLAGSLRSNRSRVIGLIISDIENTFFAEVVSGAEAEAAARQYSVLIANTGEDIVREKAAVVQLIERRIDGLLLAPAEGDHDYLIEELSRGFPVVTINRTVAFPGCGTVMTENAIGAMDAVAYLVSRGHKRIGAVMASAGLTTTQERFHGFRAAMITARIPVRREWLAAAGDVGPEAARIAALRMFGRKDHPTALLCGSHRILEGVLRALGELGLSHGCDVEVVSFDNVPWAELLDPPVAVIAQPTRQIGRDAVRMLIRMMTGAGKAEITRLPAQLITRRARDRQGRRTAALTR